MSTVCGRPQGGGGLAHVEACGQGEGDQKRDFFVDFINAWPLCLAIHLLGVHGSPAVACWTAKHRRRLWGQPGHVPSIIEKCTCIYYFLPPSAPQYFGLPTQYVYASAAK